MPTTLRDEIKQTKPFARPADEALLSILRTAAVLEHAENEVLKAHGLTHTQYNVLRILRGAGKRGLCGRDVAQRMVSNVPDVSRLLDRMEDTGLIARSRDPDDRRHVTARITDAGRKVLAEATPALERSGRARIAGLSPLDVRTLIRVLAAIREQR
ncbi:MAG TPA: MarR family transcriptional regulator [Gemmatimonadaceae bacterium]|nr:MarR family transcriptional regulator [Gemmatimonadaceae bacterium]